MVFVDCKAGQLQNKGNGRLPCFSLGKSYCLRNRIQHAELEIKGTNWKRVWFSFFLVGKINSKSVKQHLNKCIMRICMCVSEYVIAIDLPAIMAIIASIWNGIWNALSCAIIELTCYRKFMSVKRASWKHIAKPKICTHTPTNKYTRTQTQTNAEKCK